MQQQLLHVFSGLKSGSHHINSVVTICPRLAIQKDISRTIQALMTFVNDVIIGSINDRPNHQFADRSLRP